MAKHTRVTENEKKRRKQQVKRNRTLATILIVILVIGGIVFAVDKFIRSRYNQGDKIDGNMQTAEEIKDDVVNILVCGIDYDEGRTSANTDVILYVSCDIKDNKVSAFQIPRDTYIGTDVSGTGKINSVYSHGGSENPIMDLINVINDKLKLPVDHYVTLDMDAFIAMVDSIDGGLDMYVPYPIILKDKETGREEAVIETPGWYKVNGYLAEKIVRNRNYPNSDTQRLEVQSYFYASLVKYFTENLTPSDFIKIMSRFTQHITTDMHWTKIASLAQFAFGVDYNDMTLIKPSVHGYDVIKEGKSSPTNLLVCEEEQWAEYLNTYCRPHQTPVSAADLTIPSMPPKGEIVRDYGVTQDSVTTIAEILGKTEQ